MSVRLRQRAVPDRLPVLLAALRQLTGGRSLNDDQRNRGTVKAVCPHSLHPSDRSTSKGGVRSAKPDSWKKGPQHAFVSDTATRYCQQQVLQKFQNSDYSRGFPSSPLPERGNARSSITSWAEPCVCTKESGAGSARGEILRPKRLVFRHRGVRAIGRNTGRASTAIVGGKYLRPFESVYN